MFQGVLNVAELGARFDLGTPIAGAVGDLIHGGGQALYISLECGYTIDQIRDLLEEAGIETWAPAVDLDGDLVLHVRPADADQALEVLEGAGIAVV